MPSCTLQHQGNSQVHRVAANPAPGTRDTPLYGMGFPSPPNHTTPEYHRMSQACCTTTCPFLTHASQAATNIYSGLLGMPLCSCTAHSLISPQTRH